MSVIKNASQEDLEETRPVSTAEALSILGNTAEQKLIYNLSLLQNTFNPLRVDEIVPY